MKEPLKAGPPVCADHEQVGVCRVELRQDFLMDVWRLLNAESDGNLSWHRSCHSPQVARESFTIGVVENQRRKIHGGEVREHVQHCQPSLVPAGDGCRVIERVLRDVREIDGTEDVSDAEHSRPLFCGWP